MGAGVEIAASDINIHVNRTSTETEIDFRIRADSIINADVKTDAAMLFQSKLDMQAATQDQTELELTQADLGLASSNKLNLTQLMVGLNCPTNGVLMSKIERNWQHCTC